MIQRTKKSKSCFTGGKKRRDLQTIVPTNKQEREEDTNGQNQK